VPEQAARACYRVLLWIAMPWLLLHLFLRGRRQPEYRRHIGERFGIYAPRNDPRPVLWIHAVSVGETHAASPLIAALTAVHPEFRVLVSHMTPTGRAVTLPNDADIERVYLPYDYPHAVRRFLSAYRPSLGIFMETEVWPNLVFECARQGVPLALANGRLSQRSLLRGMRWQSLIAAALARVRVVLVQSPDDARRLKQLAGIDALVLGNLKFDLEVPGNQIALAGRFRAMWPQRKVLLCASTREGEETLILDAFGQARVPAQVLLVLVPRHPQRFDEIERLVLARGMTVKRRSAMEAIGADCQVVLGDSMGEMFAYYGSADVAYIGGGLLPFGTHNLIEACAIGCPVLLGPHTFNFAEAARDAIEAGGALRVADAGELVRRALDLLEDAKARQAMSEAGLGFARAHRGATAKTVAALAPLFVSAARAR
jgi:3-deoxy-D-manno-octulosonic-acid transferase